jgi:pimeloyl-ACP methyl ester carboxylesterase
MPVVMPETRYAKAPDGVHIAYQVVGSGPFDLIHAFAWCSHIEFSWSRPAVARFYEHLSSFCRLILFDNRGTGLSDQVAGAPTMEDRLGDIRSVLDAVGSQRAALLGTSEGACPCVMFAATYPERTTAMVLFGPFVVGTADEECPWAWTTEWWDLFRGVIESGGWGTPDGSAVEFATPSLIGDEAAREWYAHYWRSAASPGAALAQTDVMKVIDIRPVLPTVRVPTLVLHRTDETWVNINYGRYTAAKIPGATLIELPGTDHYPWEQNADEAVGQIEEFLTGARHEREIDRVLATVLFTDIVESTQRASELGDRSWRELLDAHDDMVRRQLERFAGHEVETTGDGFLATFDGPARGIRCALAISDGAQRLGIGVRAGLHTGELERRGEGVGGIAVHIGSRVAARAQADEVLVSSTVKDLVAGSRIEFAERGEHTLKGLPGTWRLFAVVA